MNEHPTLTAIRPEVTASTRKVLVADDEAGLARAIARVLTAAGFEVVVVNDGNQAVNAIVRSSFDVILSDINMPGTSGIDLLRVIRAYDLDVPVVLMTATPELDDVLTALELGALHYLTKPFSLETVVSMIERASKLHSLARLKRQALALQGRHADEAGDVTALGIWRSEKGDHRRRRRGPRRTRPAALRRMRVDAGILFCQTGQAIPDSRVGLTLNEALNPTACGALPESYESRSPRPSDTRART